MNVTKIEWTTFSANPIKYRDAEGKSVWACVHHSPGCLHCYAETLAKRYGRGGPFNVQTTSKDTPYLGEKELRQMLTAKTIQGVPVSGSRVFVGDMTDIFGEWVPDDLLDRLFAVFALRPDVTWQVLTKRAKRMREYFSDVFACAPNDSRREAIERAQYSVVLRDGYPPAAPRNLPDWPLPNVWLGVSAEDQQRADERIPLLLDTPAAVRFVSAEPLIAPIDLTQHLRCCCVCNVLSPDGDCDHAYRNHEDSRIRLSWVIVGGESGPGARPCQVEWVRSIVRQCRDAGVSCFVKQLGSMASDVARPVGVTESERLAWMRDGWTRIISDDGECFTKHPRLTDRKGGDPSEWPADLRVRQFPSVEVPA